LSKRREPTYRVSMPWGSVPMRGGKGEQDEKRTTSKPGREKTTKGRKGEYVARRKKKKKIAPSASWHREKGNRVEESAEGEGKQSRR